MLDQQVTTALDNMARLLAGSLKDDLESAKGSKQIQIVHAQESSSILPWIVSGSTTALLRLRRAESRRFCLGTAQS
jgi:hypothetical protein